MSQFGETLFRPSRFVRWTLSPILVAFVALIPTAIDRWTLTIVRLMVLMEGICLCLLAGFWLPPRPARWAFRTVSGLVFLGFTGYVIDMLRSDYGIPAPIPHRGDASLTNAVIGFVVIGLPCLWYCLGGRFTDKPSRDR